MSEPTVPDPAGPPSAPGLPDPELPHPDLERPELEALGQVLADALAVTEAVPPHLAAMADGLFAWRGIDAELAALVADTADAEGAFGAEALAGVRSGGGPRMVSFEADHAAVEVEVVQDRDARILTGLVVGDQASGLEVERPGELPLAVEVDDLGRFNVVLPAPGPARLVVTLAGGSRVATEWITL